MMMIIQEGKKRLREHALSEPWTASFAKNHNQLGFLKLDTYIYLWLLKFLCTCAHADNVMGRLTLKKSQHKFWFIIVDLYPILTYPELQNLDYNLECQCQ